MPSPIRNDYTIRMLVQNTYTHMKNRFDYKERDVLKGIIIRKVLVYDGKQPGKARTVYHVKSSSYPQYKPYYTEMSLWSHYRRKQRTYKHEYEVVIALDKLSIDVPVKLRTGADAKWDFSPAGRAHKVGTGRSQRIVEGTNTTRNINGDHWMRLSWIRKQAGILYGKTYANGPPVKTNPHNIQFLTKHELMVIEVLMNRGILK